MKLYKNIVDYFRKFKRTAVAPLMHKQCGDAVLGP
jgi:hypothetical protein